MQSLWPSDNECAWGRVEEARQCASQYQLLLPGEHGTAKPGCIPSVSCNAQTSSSSEDHEAGSLPLPGAAGFAKPAVSAAMAAGAEAGAAPSAAMQSLGISPLPSSGLVPNIAAGFGMTSLLAQQLLAQQQHLHGGTYSALKPCPGRQQQPSPVAPSSIAIPFPRHVSSPAPAAEPERVPKYPPSGHPASAIPHAGPTMSSQQGPQALDTAAGRQQADSHRSQEHQPSQSDCRDTQGNITAGPSRRSSSELHEKLKAGLHVSMPVEPSPSAGAAGENGITHALRPCSLELSPPKTTSAAREPSRSREFHTPKPINTAGDTSSMPPSSLHPLNKAQPSPVSALQQASHALAASLDADIEPNFGPIEHHHSATGTASDVMTPPQQQSGHRAQPSTADETQAEMSHATCMDPQGMPAASTHPLLAMRDTQPCGNCRTITSGGFLSLAPRLSAQQRPASDADQPVQTLHKGPSETVPSATGQAHRTVAASSHLAASSAVETEILRRTQLPLPDAHAGMPATMSHQDHVAVGSSHPAAGSAVDSENGGQKQPLPSDVHVGMSAADSHQDHVAVGSSHPAAGSATSTENVGQKLPQTPDVHASMPATDSHQDRVAVSSSLHGNDLPTSSQQADGAASHVEAAPPRKFTPIARPGKRHRDEMQRGQAERSKDQPSSNQDRWESYCNNFIETWTETFYSWGLLLIRSALA